MVRVYLSMVAFLAVSLFSFMAFGAAGQGGGAPMVTVWEVAEERTLRLPLVSAAGYGLYYEYDVGVDWGDGTPVERFHYLDNPRAVHVYDRPGVYTVTLKGRVESWDFQFSFGGICRYGPQLLRVDDLGDMGWKDLSYAFRGCPKLTRVAAGDGSYLSGVESLMGTFMDSPLVRPETGDWDVSRVRVFSGMFQRAYLARPETGSWDISSARMMSRMFYEAISADPDVSGWKMTFVESIDEMFYGAFSALPVVDDWHFVSLRNNQSVFYGTRIEPDDLQGKKLVDICRRMGHRRANNCRSVEDVREFLLGGSAL